MTDGPEPRPERWAPVQPQHPVTSPLHPAALPPHPASPLRASGRWLLLGFMALSAGWLAVSDAILAMLELTPGRHLMADTIKGLLYVGVSGLALATWLRHRDREVTRAIDAALAARDWQTRTLEHLAVPVLIKAKGKVQYANRAALQLFRTARRSDLVGRTVTDLVSPEEREGLVTTLEALRAGEPPTTFTKRIVRMDGSQAPVECTPLPTTFEGEPAYLTLLRDETRIHQHTARLHNAEARYRALFDQAHVAIVVADQDTGTILEANRAAEELLGRTPEDLVGLHHSLLHPPQDRPTIATGFKQATRDGGTQMYVVRGDGTQLPVRIHARALELGQRRLRIGVFLDLRAEVGTVQAEERLAAAAEARDPALAVEHVRSALRGMSVALLAEHAVIADLAHRPPRGLGHDRALEDLVALALAEGQPCVARAEGGSPRLWSSGETLQGSWWLAVPGRGGSLLGAVLLIGPCPATRLDDLAIRRANAWACRLTGLPHPKKLRVVSGESSAVKLG